MGSNPTSTAADLREHRSWQPIGGRVVLPWSHLVVSLTSRMRSHRRAQPQLSCLVTAIADDPEQKRARRRIVRLAVHGTGCVTQAWYLSHASLARGRVGCRPASAAPVTAAEGEQ